MNHPEVYIYCKGCKSYKLPKEYSANKHRRDGIDVKCAKCTERINNDRTDHKQV